MFIDVQFVNFFTIYIITDAKTSTFLRNMNCEDFFNMHNRMFSKGQGRITLH